MKTTTRLCAAAVAATSPFVFAFAFGAAGAASAQAGAEMLRVVIGVSKAPASAAVHELALANASCVSTTAGRSAPGANRSLPVTWSRGPAGTRSYALTLIDPDVPLNLSTLNQPGTSIAFDAPRQEFVHWVLADIPGDRTTLPEALDGDGHLQGGLPLERTVYGVRGQNGFAAFMKDGPYGGYMGPCPPWNDERVHRYRVTVYALDVDTLGLSGAFSRADLLRAMKTHVLATGSASVDYFVNRGARR
ncbi:YbhB/YbcL family Raf kinase inhibitor-like protein [Paraburkholderia bryophila]|uniref:YbhB/YbcL family Raf kinase inhibitor-like protein n=1 Tax=Burkholderiaceae TaxID=119060 RepID=UPI00068ED464|nr:YbhB/YbcL family Raf kinase inhibitor-like protein [Burkholderia sp. 9120]